MHMYLFYSYSRHHPPPRYPLWICVPGVELSTPPTIYMASSDLGHTTSSHPKRDSTRFDEFRCLTCTKLKAALATASILPLDVFPVWISVHATSVDLGVRIVDLSTVATIYMASDDLRLN